MLSMAGIFEWLARSRIRAVQYDPMAMELQTAKEILAEVFGVRVSEVDEMILSRFEASGNEDSVIEEKEPWPQEFRLDE
jgi:L-fucose isomerase-like protein